MVLSRYVHVIRHLAAIISLCLCHDSYSISHTINDAVSNHGEIKVTFGNTIQNNSIIHNYHGIIGTGTINHSAAGRIYNYANFQPYRDSNAYQQYLTPPGSSVPEQIAADWGNATYYELVNREQAGGIRTFCRWDTAYVADSLIILPDRASHIEERADYSTLYTPDSEQTAILHDTHSTISINASNSDVHVYPSFFSVDGYIGKTSSDPPRYIAPDTDRDIVIRKIGTNMATFYGDSSWFNGVFKLEEGSATLLDRGKMFGGDVDLATGTTLIWKGGEKDEYNTPHIEVGPDAKLDFDLPAGENAILRITISLSVSGAI
nr:hypothetical protein [Alphaproteobacteria bacterium]